MDRELQEDRKSVHRDPSGRVPVAPGDHDRPEGPVAPLHQPLPR
jgi:hypothetical protein